MPPTFTSYLTEANRPTGAPAPEALYRFENDGSALDDRTANGHDLTVEAGPEAYATDQLEGFNFAGGQRIAAAASDALRIGKDSGGGGDASLTLEYLYRYDSVLNARLIGCSVATSESLETNYLYSIHCAGGNGGNYESFREYGSGGSNIFTNFECYPTTRPELVTLTISADGLTIKLYRNGALIGTVVETQAAQKATSGNTQRLRIGGDLGAGGQLDGIVYGIRLTTAVYTAAQVQEAFDNIATMSGAEIESDKNLILGNNITDLKVIDNTVGSFGTGTGAYGADKTGKIKTNGVETSLTDFSFGTVAAGVNDRAWRNSSDPFVQKLGIVPGSGIGASLTMVGTDQAKFANTISVGSWRNSGALSSHLKWRLQGNFRIEYDFSGVSFSGGQWNVNLWAVSNIGDVGTNGIRAAMGEANFFGSYYNDGTQLGLVSSGSPVASGKLRIDRVSGSTYRIYYDSGSGWVQLGGDITASNTGAGDVFVYITNDVLSTTGSATVSGFTLVSGTVVNDVGWSDELGAAPDGLVGVVTEQGATLLDKSDNSIWAHHMRRDDRAYEAKATTTNPRRLSMQNGVHMIGMGGNPGQGLIITDFTVDTIHKQQAGAAEGFAGLIFGRTNGYVDGAIRRRNTDAGYDGGTSDSDWGTTGNTVTDQDIYEDGGYLYWTVSTGGGVSVFKYERWIGDNTPDVENSFIALGSGATAVTLDQSDGELFYIEGSGASPTIYSVEKSTWETAMDGGAFTADDSAAFTGTLSNDTQRRIIRSGTDIFICADEGIYRNTWDGGTAGSWVLLFGDSGSGATFEILDPYDRINAINAAADGLLNGLLAVATLDTGPVYKAYLINLDTGALASNGSIDISSSLSTEPRAIAG
jgi:hypothetical protein